MQGKTVVVTGATSGIGRAAAMALAKLGADLALLGRSQDKLEATRAEIEAAVGRACVQIFRADFERMEEVRAAGQALLALPRIDVLLNNAGLILTQREVTTDGFEKTFAVNHLAPYLLTRLLLPKLLEHPGARIVNTSSDAHRFGHLDLEDLHAERFYGTMKTYGGSKLANVLFTTELVRRLQGRDLRVWALHPGAVSTGMGTNNGWLGRAMQKVLKPFFKTPLQGAATSIHLCSQPIDAPSGSYFVDCAPVPPLPRALDPEQARILWEASEEMLGLVPLVLGAPSAP